MKLKVGKGTKMIDVYYTYLFFKSEEMYDVMIEFYKQNKWWFDHLPDNAKEQCVREHERAKELLRNIKNNKAVEFLADEFK